MPRARATEKDVGRQFLSPAVAEPLNYVAIQDRLKRENRMASLQTLEPGFFQELERYERGLQEDHLREQDRAPGSPKATMLHDELQNTRLLAEALYEARERKIVQRALTAARGGSLETANMTKGEAELAQRLVDVLGDGRRLVLRPDAAAVPAHAAGGKSTGSPSHATPDEANRTPGPEAQTSDAPEPAGAATNEPSAAPPEAEAPPRVLVRLLEAVPPFQASDLRTYRLNKGDVVSLPRDAARALLVHRKAVEVKPEPA